MVNTLPNDKVLDKFKLQTFAGNKNVTKKLTFVVEGVENILEEGENACYQHFLLFPHHFQNASFSGLFKVRKRFK